MIPAEQRNEPVVRRRPKEGTVTELLLLADGRILVHNLTPAMAALLSELNLEDNELAVRSSLWTSEPLPDTPNQTPGPKARPHPAKPSNRRQPAAPRSVSHL